MRRFIVEWHRSLTGEYGFAADITENTWKPVATLEEATVVSKEVAEALANSINCLPLSSARAIEVG